MTYIDTADCPIVIKVGQAACPDCTDDQVCAMGEQPHGAISLEVHGYMLREEDHRAAPADAKCPDHRAVMEGLMEAFQMIGAHLGVLVLGPDDMARIVQQQATAPPPGPFGFPSDPRAGGKGK